MSGTDEFCTLAAIAHSAGKLSEALAAFTRARELHPGALRAWNGSAAVLADMGRIDEAVSLLEAALESTGFSTSVAANLAILLERQGRFAESAEVAQRVLDLEPAHADARLTLGLALLRLGRATEAVAHFQVLAAAHPEHSVAALNLGEALMAVDDYAQALVAYERALALDPMRVSAWIGKGQALAMLQRFAEADAVLLACFHAMPKEAAEHFHAMAARHGQQTLPAWRPRAEEIFLSRRWSAQQNCDWQFRADYVRAMSQYADRLAASSEAAHDPSLVLQSSLVPITRGQRHALLDALARGVIESTGAPVRRRRFRPAGPLRLGFISSDFRDHPVAQLHWRHLALHDRSRFTVHAYSLLEKRDSVMRQKIVESVDHYHDLSQASAIEAAWKIARDGIDILVHITGFLENARQEILALRPAPLLVSLMGSLTPFGKQFVDYKFTDPITTADASEFTEALAILPDVYHLYNDQEPIAESVPLRSGCGLPEDGFVFCGFNSGFKIEPEIFDAWMQLLKDLPGSVLWLRGESPAMMGNLRREAVARGVGSERLVFAPRMDRAAHLARHACADLFLDTWACNAGTTAADALWAGLPVLTRMGDTMASRVAASIVTAAGLPELVVNSAEDYQLLAYRLATSPDTLRSLRQRLIERRLSGQLFDTRRKVRQLERGFEMMWERHLRGEPPATFAVPDDG